ncbi:helix-turn-helix domain-containing protein [Rhizobium sp. 'Codium 1']|uniref:helix-turn-helix domain-containing protein n=1 Tax=Rhizobium sp. 'Codium 1' TaxID=2940484 RepID=UPI001E43D492|nr:AraC family transcriptional regulator [Rhizobium sp. 'Codium 1']MCC8934767.1 AraC family transcriptional regulator [Rhizobium sp. 'Codium 1']
MDALAAVTRLSVGHFSRAFKVSYGEPPTLYVMRKRVSLAQQLMLTTEEPLCQIAACCGLADQSHLSKLFRRYIGTSPLAWRKQNRTL